MGYLLEFKDGPATAMFGLAPETAIGFFKAKGLTPTFDYRDMIQAEHDAAFTVAKMMDVDLLRTTQALVAQGISDGWSKERFVKELGPKLQAAGWWGTAPLDDPLTGATVDAKLGSAHRLRTIYRSNLQSAYSVGQWERIHEQAEAAPLLLYDAVDDHRTREEHGAWDNLLLPVDDAFWGTHMPPNGYNCRCGVIQISEDEAEAMGLTPSKRPRLRWRDWTNPRTGKTQRVPEGIDPGWAHNPGQTRIEELQALLAEKVATLDPGAQQAYHQAAKAYQTERAAAAAQQALAKAEGAAQLARRQAQVFDTAAEWQIDQALANKTPYLAKAIKQLQATKSAAELSPAQLLAKANEKAAAAETSAFLTTYKQAIVAGKTPPDKAAAIYQALSDADKAKVGEQIAALQAKKAAEQALAALDADGSGVYGKALAALKSSGEADAMSPVALWQAVTAAGDAAKAKIVQGVHLGNYKKAVLAGKTPSDNQLAAYQAQPPDKKAAIDDALAKAIAAAKAEATPATPGPPPPAAPAPSGPPIDPAALVRIGPQAGSNPGGLFLDESTGVTWYIKQPASADIARNEVLAGKLYQAAGIEAPDLEVITFEGAPAIASRIVDGLERGQAGQLARAGGAHEGFVVDAWLANWDVIGLGFDNLLLKGGRAVRVDTGGALRYRAQGTAKGAAWGDSVTEIDSLRNAGTNPQAAAVFGDISQEALVAGARQVLSVDAAQIRALVDAYGPTTTRERDALVKRLLARQADIAKRFPGARTPTPAAMPADRHARVTDAELRTIREARANGYAIATDKDMVEDQEVLFWQELGPDGMPHTAADLKVRGRGAQAIEALLSRSGSDIKGDLDDKLLTAIKGLLAHADTEGLREIDQQRINAALSAMDATDSKLRALEEAGQVSAAAAQAWRAHYYPWYDALEAALAKPLGARQALRGPGSGVFAGKPAPAVTAGEAPTLIKREDNPFEVKRIRHGRTEATGQANTTMLATEFYEGTIAGARVRYWPPTSRLRAMAGRVLIESPGDDAAAAARVYAALEELGIDTQRPATGDAEELYLRQTAYALVQGYPQLEQGLAGIPDQGARIRYLRDHLRDITGQDVVGLPTYRPEGDREAFGHGHHRRRRPDLTGQAWDTFTRDYRLVHANTGGLSMPELVDVLLNSGGKMAPSTDKLRRGIPLGGMSPEADLESGGASYFFTRLRSAGQSRKSAGFVWKADAISRVDAIAYDHDAFGRTTGDYVLTHRKSRIADWQRNATRGGNEVIFKHGLSLFDGLDAIVAKNATERKAILAVMRKHGYTRWPDGRDLEDVVTT